MAEVKHTGGPIAHNIKLVSHLDLPGAGQVNIAGNYAYIGHITNKERLGTSILDISDPRNIKIVSQIFLDDPNSHSHKARVAGDIMIVNSERNSTVIGRKAELLPPARTKLRETLGREPTHAEIAEQLSLKPSDIPMVEEAERNPYANGGIKIYDVKDRSKPKLIAYQKTGGRGVHRFDMDENYAYISTEMPGYIGHILVNYDLSNPSKPEEVSRWWMPGQHIAGGEVPTWPGRVHRLHHALRSGDRLWAGCWMAGVRVIDVSDIRKPQTIGEFNYHPPFPEPSHTFMEVPFPINGRRIAIVVDEEDHVHNVEDLLRRRGRPHACMWVLDVTDLANIKALSTYEVSELDSPWSRAAPARFGAHQCHEKMDSTLVYCAWYSGGLRIVDIADPTAPREVGYYIPVPYADKIAPQTNDVYVDKRGLIFSADRWRGLDVLEFTGSN